MFPFLPPEFERFLGRLHPLVVHFPIALILTAALFELGAAFLKRERPSIVGGQCLLVGGLTAVLAALLGWLNAAHEPRPSNDLIMELHRWAGVTTATAAVVAIGFGLGAPRGWVLSSYRASLLVTAALVTVGGHLGGTMVFGPGYLLRAFEKPPLLEAAPSVANGDTPHQVQALLNENCVHCHGPDRQRAQLRLDHVDQLITGATSAVVIPGDANGSLLLQRISLPPEHADLMPADGDRLDAAAIDLIRGWIDGSAPAREPTADPRPPSAPPLALNDDEQVDHHRAVTAITQRGGVVMPVVAHGWPVEVNFARASTVTDADLMLLIGLEPTLVELNCAGTDITDDGMATIAGFPHLRRLRLSNTAITDAGLEPLAALGELESLNCYGTKVSDAGLATLEALPNLRRLYLWNTQVTEDGAARARARQPQWQLHLGKAAEPDMEDEIP